MLVHFTERPRRHPDVVIRLDTGSPQLFVGGQLVGMASHDEEGSDAGPQTLDEIHEGKANAGV